MAGLRVGDLGLAPYAPRGLAGLAVPAVPLRPGGAYHGGADHQRRLDAGDGRPRRRARLPGSCAEEGRDFRGEPVERSRRAPALHAVLRRDAAAVADTPAVAGAADRAVRLLQPARLPL